MAKSRKRTGAKSPHKKSLFSLHPPIALKNKELRKKRDEKLKLKAQLKKRHRHLWRLQGQPTSEKRQICSVCDSKRIKKYDSRTKNLQSRRSFTSHSTP